MARQTLSSVGRPVAKSTICLAHCLTNCQPLNRTALIRLDNYRAFDPLDLDWLSASNALAEVDFREFAWGIGAELVYELKDIDGCCGAGHLA